MTQWIIYQICAILILRLFCLFVNIFKIISINQNFQVANVCVSLCVCTLVWDEHKCVCICVWIWRPEFDVISNTLFETVSRLTWHASLPARLAEPLQQPCFLYPDPDPGVTDMPTLGFYVSTGDSNSVLLLAQRACYRRCLKTVK